MTVLRHAMNRATRRAIRMFVGAVFALGAAVVAARSGSATFDAWFWMPVVWGAVTLGGLSIGIARYGMPEEAAAPPSSGDLAQDLTSTVNRWQSGHGLPAWQRVTAGVATISTAVAGLVIASVTGEVFLDMPFIWWVIGMVILGGVGVAELR